LCASAASACWPTCRRRGWTCWGAAVGVMD
jgi:hypothetical protein